MYTPEICGLRKNLRQAIISEFPSSSAMQTFEQIKNPEHDFIEMYELERFCEKALCPAAALEHVFAPYGVKSTTISDKQWGSFMNDDFAFQASQAKTGELNDRQMFILTKFIRTLSWKFGGTMSERWSAVVARNPPNTQNSVLKLSALCSLYQFMNLPFSVSEFVDSLFIFYGKKVDGIDFSEFSRLFNTFE